MNLAEIALAPGRRPEAGARTAFLTAAGPVSNAVFQQQVGRVEAGLRALALRPGDRILLRMTNSVPFAAVFLAAVRIGAVPVLQNSQFGERELSHILGLADPALIVLDGARAVADASHGLAPGVRRVVVDEEGLRHPDGARIAAYAHGAALAPPYEAGRDEPAFVVFTSGTTGMPKGIVHAHRWLEALGDSNRRRIPPREDDVVLATGEWSFVSALGHNVLFALRNGVPASVLEDRASPERILSTIARDRVTLLFSVATLYRRILAHDGIEDAHDLSSLRGVNSTGEPIEASVQRAWARRYGCPIWEHYGVSEAQMVLGHSPVTEARAGTVGPDWGAGAAILNDQLEPLPAGETGILAFDASYPGFFLGYLGDEQQTRRVFQRGWFVTSDLASRDADGYVRIIGRRDDCFKSKGVLIAPGEVEEALMGLDEVAQACVFPVPDAETGHVVAAAIVPRRALGEAPAAWLKERLAGRLAAFKVPQIVVQWPKLPINVNGKVQRSEVARLYAQGAAPD